MFTPHAATKWLPLACVILAATMADCEETIVLSSSALPGEYAYQISLTRTYAIKQYKSAQDSASMDSSYFHAAKRFAAHLKSSSCNEVMDGISIGLKSNGSWLRCDNCTYCDPSSKNTKRWKEFKKLFLKIGCLMDAKRIQLGKLPYIDSIEVARIRRTLHEADSASRGRKTPQDSAYIAALKKRADDILEDSKRTCTE